MSDLTNGPVIAGPRYPSYDFTPAGSTVDLDPAEDGRADDLDRLVATTSQLLVGCRNLSDKDIKDAVSVADRVIHFCRLHTYGPVTPPSPAALESLPPAARVYLRRLVTFGPDQEIHQSGGDARRHLLKQGYGQWLGDGFHATDRGRALLAAGGVLLSGCDEVE